MPKQPSATWPRARAAALADHAMGNYRVLTNMAAERRPIVDACKNQSVNVEYVPSKPRVGGSSPSGRAIDRGVCDDEEALAIHARLMIVELGAENIDLGQRLADRWLSGVSTLPGFHSVSFIFDPLSGECGYFSLWETKEAAMSVAHDIGPQLTEALRRHAKGPPRVRYFDVYEPRR